MSMLHHIKEQLDLARRNNLIVYAKYFPVVNNTTTIVIRFLETTPDEVKAALAEHFYTRYKAHVQTDTHYLSVNVMGRLPEFYVNDASV